MPVVKLYANLRKLAETKELSVAGKTVGAVVNELARQKPPIGEIVLRDGGLAPHVVVTLNGHNITDIETPVVEQDIVAIFPPIAGGTSPLIPFAEHPSRATKSRGGVRRNYGWLV